MNLKLFSSKWVSTLIALCSNPIFVRSLSIKAVLFIDNEYRHHRTSKAEIAISYGNWLYQLREFFG